MKTKLKMTKHKNGRPNIIRLKVTDRTGYYEIFDSVEKAATAMKVKSMTIYMALSKHTNVRGCLVERI